MAYFRPVAPPTDAGQRACDNFLYGFKGAPTARQPSGPLDRIGRSERVVIGKNA